MPARLTELLPFTPQKWLQIVGEDYCKWLGSHFEGSSPASRDWLLKFETQLKNGWTGGIRAEPYQREAILRLIYMLEFGIKYSRDGYLPMNQIALEMATGSGKTCVITNFISWAKACSVDVGADFFVLLSPNTIVRERLWDGLCDAANPFQKIGFPSPSISTINLAESEVFSLDHHDVAVANIHRMFQSNRAGSAVRQYLAQTNRRFIVVNDEAHNSVTAEYDQVMDLFSQLPGYVARVDLTATPKRPDLREIPSHFIYKYPPLHGIDGIGTYSIKIANLEEPFVGSPSSWQLPGGRQILKRPAIWRPVFESVKFSLKGGRQPIVLTGDELAIILSKDIEHKERAKVIREEKKLPSSIHKSSISSTKVFKEVLLKHAFDRLVECRKNSPKGLIPYKPILFAIAMNRSEAKDAAKILENFGLRTLLVIGKNEKIENEGDTGSTADDLTATDIRSGEAIPKEALRKMVNKLGQPNAKVEFEQITYECDYDAVVSVYMLKEGWDVNCVEVMALLRPFESRLFAEQTVGRGLRIRRDLVDQSHEQILNVVEPPNWGLQELWEELGAEVEGTDSYRCRRLLRALISQTDEPKTPKLVAELIDGLESDHLRNELTGSNSNREKLILSLLDSELSKIKEKDALRLLKDEAKGAKSLAIEGKLQELIKDEELGVAINGAIARGDHAEIIKIIDEHLTPPDDIVPERRENLVKLLTLARRDGDLGKSERAILDQLFTDFREHKFDDCFDGLRLAADWSITEISVQSVEKVKAGKRVLEKWPAEFHEYVGVGADEKDAVSLAELMASLIDNLADKLERDTIQRRLTSCPGCYREIYDHIKEIPNVRKAMEHWLTAEGAKHLQDSWMSCTNSLTEKIHEWLDFKISGQTGEQKLPEFPRKPTGRYELNDYRLSLFKREYTQASYEKRFTDILEEKEFRVSSGEFVRFNGWEVLAWTTSHGIIIPLSNRSNYHPDFLVVLKNKSTTDICSLLVEVKRDDYRGEDGVEAKRAASEAFCSEFINLEYGIVYGKDLGIANAA